MKKIILSILILLLAAGAVYAWKNNNSDSSPQQESSESTPPREEGLGKVNEGIEHAEMEETLPPAAPNPTPTPPLPPPAPVPFQDDLGDVDVAPPKVFNLTGKNFSFSQSEIRVKKGDRIVINFESTDGFHDWVVDEFSAKTDRVNPGTKTSVEFIADKTGTFEYYCSVSIHRAAGMVGRLIVE